MALGVNYETASGDFAALVKYDARAGRIFRVDRVDRVNDPVDITKTFKAVVDMENVEVGWMDFPTGAAPVFALAPISEKFPDKPADPKMKQGVRLTMKLGKDCCGDTSVPREMATSAKAAMRGIDILHDAYKEQAHTNAGKLPVVILKDTIAITSEGGGKKTTNYQPVFEIVAWVPRPGDLQPRPKSAAAAAASTRAQAPETGSTRVEAPAQKPVAVNTAVDANEFG